MVDAISDNFADRADATEAKAQLSEAQEADDFSWLMGDARGRRIVHGLLTRAGIWRLSYNDNPLRMALAEGRRNEGLMLLNTVMQHSPTGYNTMMQEAKKDD